MAKYILSIEAVRKKFFILISQIGILTAKVPEHHESASSMEITRSKSKPATHALLFGRRQKHLRSAGAPKFHLLTFSDRETIARSRMLFALTRVIAEIGLADAESELTKTGKYAICIDRHAIPLSRHVAEIFGMRNLLTCLLRPDNILASSLWILGAPVVDLPKTRIRFVKRSVL